MKSKKDVQVRIKLSEVKINEFAKFEDVEIIEDKEIVNLKFSSSALKESNSVRIDFRVTYKSNEQIFIVLDTSTFFDIHEDDIQAKDPGGIVVSKKLIHNFSAIAIGIVRGVLFEKLCETKFKNHLFPIINLEELIDKDFEDKQDQAGSK